MGLLLMKKKGLKIHNRIRKVRSDTLLKLYYKMPLQCTSCCFNSTCTETEGMNDTVTCINYKESIGINDLIDMMKVQNICIDSFCEKYHLKKEYFILMIKGKMLFKYSYYISLLTRLHIIDEFEEYKKYFEEGFNDESENGIENGGSI